MTQSLTLKTRQWQQGLWPASSTHDSHVATNASDHRISKELQAKLSVKIKCKCGKLFQKFKLRKSKAGKPPSLKEFSLCIDCWRATKPENDKPHKAHVDPSASTLFDVVSVLSDTPVGSHQAAVKSPRQPIKLDHHIFDGTFGWVVTESKKQPRLQLTLSRIT